LPSDPAVTRLLVRDRDWFGAVVNLAARAAHVAQPSTVVAATLEGGKVFDLTLPLPQVAEGYRAMDERRAFKGLPRP
jgi:class 3 adenylate cyclase